jgi:glutamyl-tRNA reductase
MSANSVTDAAPCSSMCLAGLGSSILGEPEIVAQARAAAALARQERMLGPLLDGLLTRSFAAGRRVRAITGIARGALSLSSVAVDLADSLIGDLSGCSTLVIGAGKIARAVTQRLAAAGARRIVLANRSETGSHQLAREFGGTAVPLPAIARELGRVDLVVCATGAPDCVVSRSMLATACERRDEPLVVLDLAVPRDVEPAARKLPAIVLRDIDYIQRIAAANLDHRRRELPRAAAIVRAEAERFRLWREALDAAPALNELRRHAEQIRRRELDRAIAPLGTAHRRRGGASRFLHAVAGQQAAARAHAPDPAGGSHARRSCSTRRALRAVRTPDSRSRGRPGAPSTHRAGRTRCVADQPPALAPASISPYTAPVSQ